MSTQETSVANISTYATAAVGVTTLSITSGVLVADTLASVSGYTTLQVGTNGAHVIDIPSTFLTTSGATLTVSVTSTLSVSLTGANLVGRFADGREAASEERTFDGVREHRQVGENAKASKRLAEQCQLFAA